MEHKAIVVSFPGRRLLVPWLILLMMFLPVSTWGCEPIVPLYCLLSGSTLAGPAILTRSLPWLGIAVVAKCIAFTLFEKRLSTIRAVYFMVIANIVSTIPGILLAAVTGSGTGLGLVIALPLVFGLGWLVQRRVARLAPSPPRSRISGGTAMLAFVAFFIVSMLLYGLAESALWGNNYVSYWALKLLFAALVAGSGIAISAVLEESVIADLAKRSSTALSGWSFYAPVFRANYITLGLVLLVAAVQVLPERMNAHHFILIGLGLVTSGLRG